MITRLGLGQHPDQSEFEGGPVHRLRWFSIGVLFVVAILVAGGLVCLFQARGFSASEPPPVAETWLARLARNAALPRDARARKNPVPVTPDLMRDARAHWADHCATCHANDGSGNTQMGRHSYPPAPDMRLPETQKLTDGELFYIIQNGIRLSAMPAWDGGSDRDRLDSWKLVHFIRHLPHLTGAEKQEMERLNPKGPEEREEQEQEEKFLKGEDIHEAPAQHHHR